MEVNSLENKNKAQIQTFEYLLNDLCANIKASV